MAVSFAAALVLTAIWLAAPAVAQTGPPWDGNPISPGLGPTYGEEWCAPPTGSIANQQGAPLALIPYQSSVRSRSSKPRRHRPGFPTGSTTQ